MAKLARPVVLDARMIDHSGIGAHIRGLLQGWREADPGFRPTLLGDPERLAERLGDGPPGAVVPFRAPIYGIREQIGFPVRRTRGALLHCPHYNIALRHAGPLVVTIHDLIHLDARWGESFRLKRLYAHWMLGQAIRRASHVFAVSNATADALVARFPITRERLTVTYNAPSRAFLGAPPGPEAVERVRRETGLAGEYLLTVGLYKAHKNLDFVIETLQSLWKDAKVDLSLVIAGVQEKERPALKRRLGARRLEDRVRVLDRLRAEQLPLLYRGATALIHASLLEGFGLPIVEAQAVGAPVVASRASAVPEVAGDGALYFDPEDRDDLAKQILAVVGNEGLRTELAEKGRRNMARFSWRRTAETVLSVYERIV